MPEEGIPGYSWEDLTLGYQTAIAHAKKVCPQLKIVQMPYEYDNISGSECHMDAHYSIFKCLYKAVNNVNKGLKKKDPKWNPPPVIGKKFPSSFKYQ